MGESEREAARVIVYRLDERAVRWRARWSAVLGSAATVAPAVLVVVLVHKLGYASERIAWGGGALLVVLAAARGLAERTRLARRLAAFEVGIDDAGVRVVGLRGEARTTWPETARALEIGGSLGGLRLELRDGSRVDIPRGGEHFGELREAIAARVAVERPARRRRWFRIALGAAVVVAIFFVPFMMDDLVGRSRLAAVVIVAAVWGGLVVLRSR